MATTIKSEKIFIALGDERIELTGADKEAFLEQRAKDQAEAQAIKETQEAQRKLKISAYRKLSLTDEEIEAII